MRMSFMIALLCCLAVAVFAAESPEAMAKRVKQLENSRVVLQADLATTQQMLDVTRRTLKLTQQHLDEETSKRQVLQDKMDALGKQMTTLIAANEQKAAADNTTLAKRLGKDEQSLSEKQDKDTTALRASLAMQNDTLQKMNDDLLKKIAMLDNELKEEHAERMAALDEANRSREQLKKQAYHDRTNTYIMGGLLGILSFVAK